MSRPARTSSAVCATAFFAMSMAGASPAVAQSSPAAGGAAPATVLSEPVWSVRVSANTYLIPDDENYVQPTVTADRGALHLESRYQYEDRHSTSAFIGWNLDMGDAVKFSLTPMIGGVFGQTGAVVPALEATLTWRRFEGYLEGEYVIDVGDRSSSFLYNWSEASVWATEWLRAGLVTQRTRVRRTPRDIQRGLLIGAAVSRWEGTFYLFNPGSDDQFFVASIGVGF